MRFFVVIAVSIFALTSVAQACPGMKSANIPGSTVADTSSLPSGKIKYPMSEKPS